MRRVRRRQGSDTVIIKDNYISASKAKEVGFNDMMNNFGLGRGRPRRIVISDNRIQTDESSSVGIGNLFNNYCNLSVVVIFLLVVVVLIPLGLWIKWATRPTTLLTEGLHIIEKEQADMGFAIEYDVVLVEELRKKVYNIVNVDPNEYEITMKVIYEAMKTAWPAEIADDADVRAFIFESLSSSYKIPLCIALKGKVSNKQAPSVDVGQESMPVDLNVSTQVVLEDSHDSENDLGNKEFKDSESEVENNRTQLDKLLCENMHCEDMAYVEADNIFQDHAEFNELCGDNNMGCNDVPAISVQFDEPNSDKPNSLEHSRMKILQKGFYDFQGEAAKMDSHVIEWADKLVQENNAKMLSLQDTVAEIAMKWTKVLRTGALGVRFMGDDLNTIMFNMERGQDTTEVWMDDNCLDQLALMIEKAVNSTGTNSLYSPDEGVCVEPTRGLQIKIGEQDFQRPGDSPLEEVVEKLQNEKRRVGNDSPAESNRHLKEEL
ncbi:PREDICTED: Mesoderm development candidate 2 [Prunus dulcis]|uniref:PREDICTED: Mesoderm development candidate 2 n=2 Tax=Prunus dulcis TaxID=3755 RepID=A0A5E4GLB5_PRUDU|nr:PREDICTED: Mesoderm development candidate 2 [Prunus dulcis]